MKASGYDRAAHDWYCEDRRSIDALLDVEPLFGTSWDPSCGGGNIPRALHDRGMHCYGSDIVDRAGGEFDVRDFFTATSGASNIVTNPPYGVIDAYIERALSLTTSKVCVLARLALLEGQKRREAWAKQPLARVWVSSRRISMPPGGTDIKATGGTVAFAWFVWDHAHTGEATIGWL